MTGSICVISKAVYGEYAVHDIQTNSGWRGNPYGEAYALVPGEMAEAILATGGFCDITLDETGTEVAGFTAREIPHIPEPTEAPTTEERLEALETQKADQTDVDELNEALDLLLSGVTE